MTLVQLLHCMHLLHLMRFDVFLSACCSGAQGGYIFTLLNQKQDASSSLMKLERELSLYYVVRRTPGYPFKDLRFSI